MLVRMAGVLARLRTFELIEGGRSSFFSCPAAAAVVPPPETLTRSWEDKCGVVGDAEGIVDRGGDKSIAEMEKKGGEGVGGGDGQGNAGPDAAGEGSPSSTCFLELAKSTINTGAASGADGAGDETLEDGDGDGTWGEQLVTEVDRWMLFRTTDLVAFVGTALQAGDIQAASVAWRRHGRTDRGADRTAAGGTVAVAAGLCGDAAGAGRGDEGEEGRRLEAELPGQLATVPASAPVVLLGTWLRDEVLPSLGVTGTIAVRDPYRGG